MPSAKVWVKVVVSCTVFTFGSAMLLDKVRPTEEELFQRYNPDIQRRNIENRHRRQQEFDDYVTQLKEYSKSDKPIWYAIRQNEEEKKKTKQLQRQMEMQMQKKSNPPETSE